MRPTRRGPAGPRRRSVHDEPLATGQRIFDSAERRSGVVLEHACQYSHPKADPVYSYLVRWEDGQVTSLSEMAFAEGQGLELID